MGDQKIPTTVFKHPDGGRFAPDDGRILSVHSSASKAQHFAVNGIDFEIEDLEATGECSDNDIIAQQTFAFRRLVTFYNRAKEGNAGTSTSQHVDSMMREAIKLFEASAEGVKKFRSTIRSTILEARQKDIQQKEYLKEDCKKLVRHLLPPTIPSHPLPLVHWACLNALSPVIIDALVSIQGGASLTDLVELDEREMTKCEIPEFKHVFSSIAVAPIHLALIRGHADTIKYIISKDSSCLHMRAYITTRAERTDLKFPSGLPILSLASFKFQACYRLVESRIDEPNIPDGDQNLIILKMALLGGNHEFLANVILTEPTQPFLLVAAAGGNVTYLNRYSPEFTNNKSKAKEIASFGIHYPSVLKFVLANKNLEFGDPDIGELLFEAAKRGAGASFHFISRSFNPLFQDGLGFTAAHHACEHGHLEILEILLQKLGKDTPFWHLTTTKTLTMAHIAAKNGQLEVLRWLADTLNLDMTAKTEEGWQPIHFAKRSLEVVKWLHQRDSECLKARTKERNRLVHLAAKTGNLGILDYLLSHLGKKCLNDRGCDEKSPAHWAVMNVASNMREKTLQWLLENGANFSLRCSNGRTVAHHLAKVSSKISDLDLLTWIKDQKQLKLTELDKDNNTVLGLLLSHPYASTASFGEWALPFEFDWVQKTRAGDYPLRTAVRKDFVNLLKTLFSSSAFDYQSNIYDLRYAMDLPLGVSAWLKTVGDPPKTPLQVFVDALSFSNTHQ